ncbi:hypothetical protein FDN13_06460 [Caloramator sp. E03]|uniref:YwmB family TATA-box binding protein n=1 Tax=Caloramator sp. E03 TaxID=2576307 RepID=UPI00111024BA|nr:YwmB family TATA-box binding protein [Caloramator sp. E03]QCX33378.1 hypothetical protein FDN13_06460 [Caloramator sp. E03]
MKKWAIICLISFLLLNIGYNSQVYGYSALKKCFESTDADFIALTVEGKGIIKTSDEPIDVINKMYNSIKQDSKYTLKTDGNFSELSFTDNKSSINIRAYKYKNDEIYVCLTQSQYDGIMNINIIRRTINNCFSIYGIEPSFCSLIEGKFKKSMGNEEMKEIAQKTIISSKAKLIDKMEDRTLVSFYGYSPYIKDKVEVNGQDFNINVALRFSKTEGCTYIFIGTPVINAEY